MISSPVINIYMSFGILGPDKKTEQSAKVLIYNHITVLIIYPQVIKIYLINPGSFQIF